jgi:hypothetical protein
VATLLGDKQRFAVEVGEFDEVGRSWGGGDQLRHVDLWAAGRRLTCDDNTAFVPGLCMDVRDTRNWLRSGSDLSRPYTGISLPETHRRLLEADDGSREQFWFPMWGPITDNICGHLFRDGELLLITLEFWRKTHQPPDERGKVFAAEITEDELVNVLEQTIVVLGCGDRT